MNDELFHRSIVECIRCGSCKTTCPTYDIHRDETMSGRGRIAILNGILTGIIPPSGTALAKIFSCIQCGACALHCPPGIDIPEVLYVARAYLKWHARGDKPLRAVSRLILKHPEMMFSAARMFNQPLERYLKKRQLVPEGFALPQRSLRRTQRVISPKNKRGRVAVFKGCSTTYLFPDLGRSLINVLLKLGFEVIMPRSEVCCGTPFRVLGMEHEAKSFARKNIQIFGKLKVDSVISLCPTCILALKHEYKKLINCTLNNATDIASFMSDTCDITLRSIDARAAFYHDPCHMLYGLQVADEPREVLKRCGFEPVHSDAPACCGFGGTYSVKFGGASMKQAVARSAAIERSQADVAFTSCPGCMLQLKKTLKTVDVYHIVEAIDRAVG